MAQIYPDEALLPILRAIVAQAAAGLTWALYQNDIDPQRDSVLADFDIAASWGQLNLTDTDFATGFVFQHIGVIQAASHRFENNTGVSQTIYGYVAFDPLTNKLIAVARFTDAPVVLDDGEYRSVAPLLGDFSQQPAEVYDAGTF